MSKKDWWIVDVTKEMQGTPALAVMSYFEELDEEDEVCTLFLNDIHIDAQVENAFLIKNAPNMLRLLNSLESCMNPEEKSEFNKIKKELERKDSYL